jgi:Zn-dependent alcohol dehydrogenases, class III
MSCGLLSILVSIPLTRRNKNWWYSVWHNTYEIPFMGGNERAGIIERTDSQVNHLEVGDHVFLSFSSCGEYPSWKWEIPAYFHHLFTMNFSCSRKHKTTAFTLEDASPVAPHLSLQTLRCRDRTCNIACKGVSYPKQVCNLVLNHWEFIVRLLPSPAMEG